MKNRTQKTAPLTAALAMSFDPTWPAHSAVNLQPRKQEHWKGTGKRRKPVQK